jgi:penicillin-binding protein 1A
MAQRLGVRSPTLNDLSKIGGSLTLGSQEVAPIDMATAYATIAAHGKRCYPKPVLAMTGSNGKAVTYTGAGPCKQVLAPGIADTVTSLLEGVTTRGTAAAAASLDWPIAGKTGTMDEYTDAWFIGFDPDITIGVWIGYDEKKTLGPGETGAVAALPLWIEVMTGYLAARGRDKKPEFTAPGNIVFAQVNRTDGTPSSAPDAITDAFIAGTQPHGAISAAPPDAHAPSQP